MVYEFNFKNYSSYSYDPKINAKDLNYLDYPSGINPDYINDFEYSLRTDKIKILRSSYLGWFGGNNSKDDLNYTFKKYWQKILDLLKDENYRPTIEKRRGFFDDKNLRKKQEDMRIYNKEQKRIENLTAEEERKRQGAIKKQQEAEEERKRQEAVKKQKAAEQKLKIQKLQDEKDAEQKRLAEEKRKNDLIAEQNIKDIKSRNYSFFKILGDYKIIDVNDYSLATLKSDKHWGENEFMEYLVKLSKDYYNQKNADFAEKLNRYNTLSPEEKNEVKNLERSLNGILKILKPLVLLYDPEVIRLNEELKEMEKSLPQKLKDYNVPVENLRKINLRINETKENAEVFKKKIIDIKRKIAEAKSEKNKVISQEKSKTRIKLIQYENEMKKIENRIKELDRIKENILKGFQEKNREVFYRLSELDGIRSLNEKQIREKNALLKSLEYEKILSEIQKREEERKNQEELLKQQIAEAERIYQQEKKIADLKIAEARKRKNNAENLEEWKLEELDEIKKKIKSLTSDVERKNAELHKKEAEIEYRKKITDEKLRQNFENKKLDSEIQKLNERKIILQKIEDSEKTYSENVKKEISLRQEEIEKTIKLNLKNIKEKEAKILAEESKIKLDVFSTLSDVKEQTAIKLDIEKMQQEMKNEIIRKQDVSNLLSETITEIENNEILEIENYNSFLESRIKFAEKLESKNFSLAEKMELYNEEKEDVIERMENLKTKKLKQIYEQREKAIESQMKILLIEEKENLKNQTFSMKYEIEELKRRKEISERKEDLAKFQSDNLKKELKFRQQEIELLKNIRIKVLDNERKIRRNEATAAIQDIVKNIEKTEREGIVREKLDEILDDVETKEISESVKSEISTILDKIENKEIQESAKEKMDFILGKIELHDNIDESRKVLDKILDQIEDEEIKKSVEKKLDEILDDVELDDYDFLEDDDLDDFISSVKKHISGEKKMEQFSKIDTILSEERQIDSKLKMEENIEMKNLYPELPEQADEEETSFGGLNDYTIFLSKIEDPIMREKTRVFLGNIDGFDEEEEKMPKLKNAYKQAINRAMNEDELLKDLWDGKIILGDQAKFHYEQKVNIVNQAIAEYDLHVDSSDVKIQEFFDINLINVISDKRQEITGFVYHGEKVITRNKQNIFRMNFDIKPAMCQKFLDDLSEKLNSTARSQFANEGYFEKEQTKQVAIEYIGELREEQNKRIDEASNGKEMRQAFRDNNDIENEITNIKKNMSFKMRMEIWKKTISFKFSKLLKLLWKHKGKIGILSGILASVISVILNQLGVIELSTKPKKAIRSIKQFGNDLHESGKRIIHTVQSLYRVPGNIMGFLLIIFGFFLRMLYYLSYFSGGASSSWIFGVLGSIVEISLYLDSNIEKINEETANFVEETGNIIENAGIRSQKYIKNNTPKWYWEKPPSEKTILETVESGTVKAVYKFAQGTQYTGEKIHDGAEFMREAYYYMKILIILFFTIIVLIIIRDLSNLTIIKNGIKVSKSATKRRKKT